MGYNVIDLIDKGINIANRKKVMYESIGLKKCDIPTIEIMSKVLVKETDKSIKYYEELKKEVSKSKYEEIDFYIYDKLSFLINEFCKNINVVEINNIKEYLRFSLNLEKDGKSLLIDVQGRYMKNKSDIHTKTYKTLTDMINNKDNLILMLEKTIK